MYSLIIDHYGIDKQLDSLIDDSVQEIFADCEFCHSDTHGNNTNCQRSD